MSNILDLTVLELSKEVLELKDGWNGDEPGEQERQALIAEKMFTLLAEINALYKELHNE